MGMHIFKETLYDPEAEVKYQYVMYCGLALRSSSKPPKKSPYANRPDGRVSWSYKDDENIITSTRLCPKCASSPELALWLLSIVDTGRE